MTLKDKVFGFDGRLRRRDYWAISISLSLISLLVADITRWVILGPDYALLAPGGPSFMEIAVAPEAQGVMIVFTLLWLWPGLAMNAKRAHDRDSRAGMPMALTGVSTAWSLGSPLLGRHAGLGDLVMLMGDLISIAINLYLLIVLGFLDGTQGPNRFGASPKGIGGTSAGEAAEVFS
jgi:uncharacterized membrane protein YhaH (DUF805 family)